MGSELYRVLPKVDEFLRLPCGEELVSRWGREAVVKTLRQCLDELRSQIAAGETAPNIQALVDGLPAWLKRKLSESFRPSLRRVINCTGIPLHTNLGRAPLADEAIDAIVQAARGYSTLEYDLVSGERGSRQDHVRELLCEITGAEDGIVVNNNAGAVLIVLSALAKGREVIVSRGQLVEVGGSFRIPEVMEQGGAILKEVGATNKTHLRDYEQAITENTAALLKVHTSNYRIIGFTAEVDGKEMASLAHKRGLLAIEDLGSGVLLPGFGEPTVQEALTAGMDVVTFSGDKLLGGPQAGLIVGKSSLIQQIKKHPLARALRIDKLTLAALEATLRLYRYSDSTTRVPLIRMLNKSQEELYAAAQELSLAINGLSGFKAEVIAVTGQVGGGSLPGKDMPGFAVAIDSTGGCVALEAALRNHQVPIIARIVQDRVLIDPRTLLPDDSAEILRALASLSGGTR